MATTSIQYIHLFEFCKYLLLCNGGQHYAPYRWPLISNKLCDSTLCTCGGVGGGGGEKVHNVYPGCKMDPGDKH
jgi:hypothetical protein